MSATASAISVAAGIETLKRGGSAADAAVTIAMTGTTTQLGSVVSFAGIMSLIYYDARTGKIHSLDGGYNTYRNETDPESIPKADLGALGTAYRTGTAGGGNFSPPPAEQTDLGRETLVPGYMAGFEVMHQRFGRLPWRELFAPAIWYAERGVTLCAKLAGFFEWRKEFLERTPEGRAFLHPCGNPIPRAGDRFHQPELAKTLRAVAEQGASHMYTGGWAQEFLRVIRREGGKVCAADLAEYQPTWSEPYAASFAGTTVYAPGGENFAGFNAIPSLNIAEAAGVDRMSPFWKDPNSFATLSRIVGLTEGAPVLHAEVANGLDLRGIDRSREALLSKEFGQQAAQLLEQIGRPPEGDGKDHHSNSLVVIDKEGNIAALTHSINSVVWGSTGIVVGGVPIPDSAGFQQKRLATLRPGARLPNEMVQTVAVRDEKPVFATAGIGTGLVPENIKLLVSVLGQRCGLPEVQAAPPLLTNFALGDTSTVRDVVVPEGTYSPEFLTKVATTGLKVTEIPPQTAAGVRGTIAAVSVDPVTGKRQSSDTKGLVLFGDAY
ncbi:gamma-glutamyltransferase [Nesterenkonia ebinurensis]|uniref:gamma-glutamyltransferase n=1 Tax=Nesterenkonia ebinurensis TaxID=2608252 RepID=UPI00168AB651|nr:gamma-glutamyltransferase [Nesterenkonia ebinurensis]